MTRIPGPLLARLDQMQAAGEPLAAQQRCICEHYVRLIRQDTRWLVLLFLAVMVPAAWTLGDARAWGLLVVGVGMALAGSECVVWRMRTRKG